MPKLRTSLSKLKTVKKPATQEPLWKGPEDAGQLGGISQSMLNAFCCGCRERFRVKYVLGLQPVDRFSKALEFGNMWHVCEEAFAAGRKEAATVQLLTEYAQDLCQKYPLDQNEISKWYDVILTTFPLYVDWWAKHPDVVRRTPLLQEEVFCVPYKLPSGRVVYLRGKFDSVDLVGTKKDAGIWLKENKTKSEIDVSRLERQLKFDLQTMLYLVALDAMGPNIGKTTTSAAPIKGVNYNVILRPLSGGRGTIKQREGSEGSVCGGCDGKGERTLYAGTKRETFEKPCSRCEGRGKTGAKPAETAEEFQDRLRAIIESAVGQEWGMPDGQHYFFQRWAVAISPTDVERFKRQFLNPILEQLCEWYDWIRGNPTPFDYGTDPSDRPGMAGIHFMLPFGLYNPLVENGFTDMDEYLLEGSDVGLVRKTELFTELK